MLKEIIREDAELIWHLLTTNDRLTPEQLEVLTGYRNEYLYLILGWLSKEDRIGFIETTDGLIIIVNK